VEVEGRGGFAHRVGKWKPDIIAIVVAAMIVMSSFGDRI
jgi:hypothetical protein